jgi:hypothetical protein
MTISENRAGLRLLDSSDGCHMSAPAGDVAAEYAIPPAPKRSAQQGSELVALRVKSTRASSRRWRAV